MLYYRHRRGFYALAEPPLTARLFKPVLCILFLLTILYFVGTWLFGIFGVGNSTRQTAVILTLERQVGVQVSIEGKPYSNGQNALKLYAGDSVKTSTNANALLRFFDGTVMLLKEQSEVAIRSSDIRNENSRITVDLATGGLWMSTPALSTYSGSIVRTVTAAELSYDVPARADIILDRRAVTVYAAAGLGIKITVPHSVLPVIVGEGQQFALPETFNTQDDLYKFRSPIAGIPVSTFVEQARAAARSIPSIVSSTGSTTNTAMTTLTVLSPANNTLLKSTTIQVTGSVSARVTSLRINGYQAKLDDRGAFALEVTPPDGDQTSIVVEALDQQGTVLDTVTRVLKRDRTPAAAPTITAPAKDGQTYRTQETKLVIRGTAPKGTVSILVNDYRLQLFKPENGEWSYLADMTIQNLKTGENIFSVVAVNDAGIKSPPVVLTVIQGEGTGEGVVQNPSAPSSVAAEVSETTLPNNAPVEPGTLTVTGPAAGTVYTATGSSFLLEGAVSRNAKSVWVNGYKLKLFTPGKTFWNYIADVNFGTLKTGINIYVINARDSENRILDTMTYSVTKL
ncbi:MAG: hypothetical protein WCG83_05440 [Candidatus Peregrinibacteria bacterium]